MGAPLIICVFSLIVASISSLPINFESTPVPKILISEPVQDVIVPKVREIAIDHVNVEEIVPREAQNDTEVIAFSVNGLQRNTVRPGMTVTNYAVEIDPDIEGRSFSGVLIATVTITDATREDEIVFQIEDLQINRVTFSEGGANVFVETDFNINEDDGLLEIEGTEAGSYSFNIEYSGTMDTSSRGMFVGSDNSYIGMNLHPTNARRVFPCIDEPSVSTTISFTFINNPFQDMVSNSLLDPDNTDRFRALQSPPHLWGMVAHSFSTYSILQPNIRIYGRIEGRNQDLIFGIAITNFFNYLEEWTERPYFEMVVNQNDQLAVFALPDISVDWVALSTVCIWEPHILVATDHSILQRKTVIVTLAEALARQWFGYMIYPANWQSQWVVTGLAQYAAWEAARTFQTNDLGNDITLLDMNTLFVTDIIQESLLRDGYTNSQPLETGNELFDEPYIREHMSGIVKYKAVAVMRMLRMVLGREDDDFIQSAAAAMLRSRYSLALETVNGQILYDSINGYWRHQDYRIIDDIREFLEPWVTSRGYPLITVGLRQSGLLITQEQFGFTQVPHVGYQVPLTFTTSMNPNFDMENAYNIIMMEGTHTIDMFLDEEDFVLFNILGLGYYRVNYDNALWERIIEALNDPERREQIHPINRATLVDDALNLARSGILDYDIAFQVVLSMEHETEYAPWKAFVRNMNFLRKRLVAFVDDDDDDLDPDIYLRMVRRTVGMVENEIGFYPDPLINEPAMTSLTRGLVMDHACRANYNPCIAAAVDWFYDPDASDPRVNPNIPADIRPAVYCTMVREGDQQVIDALNERLEIEESHYERVVIWESLACSRDEGFIGSLLAQTVDDDAPYGLEERSRIFAAVAESSYNNARIALNFIRMRTSDVRNMYGGPEKLEELLYMLVENMADGDLANDFNIWMDSQNSNLDDSENVAGRVAYQINENGAWDNAYLEYVYEWIDENDAPTLMVSLVLIGITFMVTLFNH